MYTTPVNVDISLFDQKTKLSKVNKSGVGSLQVSCLQSPGQEKKTQQKSPAECLALCHIPVPPGL